MSASVFANFFKYIRYPYPYPSDLVSLQKRIPDTEKDTEPWTVLVNLLVNFRACPVSVSVSVSANLKYQYPYPVSVSFFIGYQIRIPDTDT